MADTSPTWYEYLYVSFKAHGPGMRVAYELNCPHCHQRSIIVELPETATPISGHCRFCREHTPITDKPVALLHLSDGMFHNEAEH